MLDLNDLRVFVQAVECGGFAAAARRIGSPKSTVSKRVAELEASLGARLIHRTSRSFMLTDVGRDFYERARAAIIEADAAEGVVRRRLGEPIGTVRITTSVPGAQFTLADQLPRLVRAYPKIEVQVHVTDRFVDLVQEGFDIGLRSHFSPLSDSDLLQRQLSTERIVLVASPAYLARRAPPRRPLDLSEHDGLVVGPFSKTWRLQNDAGARAEVAMRPSMIADESIVLLKAAIAGLGVACLPLSMVRASVEGGELSSVLPEWYAGTVTTTLLSPHRRGQLPAVRAVIDFLSKSARAMR